MGTVHNLSVKGCLIQSEIPVAEGDYFSLKLGLRGQEYPVTVQLAAVRWADGRAFGTEFLFVEDHRPGAPAALSGDLLGMLRNQRASRAIRIIIDLPMQPRWW